MQNVSSIYSLFFVSFLHRLFTDTANFDMMRFRSTLENAWNYEYMLPGDLPFEEDRSIINFEELLVDLLISLDTPPIYKEIRARPSGLIYGDEGIYLTMLPEGMYTGIFKKYWYKQLITMLCVPGYPLITCRYHRLVTLDDITKYGKLGNIIFEEEESDED